jgi:hypothetical protein
MKNTIYTKKRNLFVGIVHLQNTGGILTSFGMKVMTQEATQIRKFSFPAIGDSYVADERRSELEGPLAKTEKRTERSL